jgi:hypothetical protein
MAQYRGSSLDRTVLLNPSPLSPLPDHRRRQVTSGSNTVAERFRDQPGKAVSHCGKSFNDSSCLTVLPWCSVPFVSHRSHHAIVARFVQPARGA